MRIQNILLVSLLVSLYGCQPEAPASKAAAPAVESPALSAHTRQAVQPAANQAAASAPVQQIEPVSAEKAAQPVAKEKVAAAGKETTLQPVVVEKPVSAQVSAAPAAKAEMEMKSVPAVSEADAMQLVKKNNCFACHAIDKKVVGPSFKDVAAKYYGDAGAEARLADKIAKGGSGAWGAMSMPANPKISEADRKILARYVLSLK